MVSMPIDSDELAAIARRYERFAISEARGSSPIYERLALAVAGSCELLAFLRSVPPERQQPNLFLAAVRHVAGLPLCGHQRACWNARRPYFRIHGPGSAGEALGAAASASNDCKAFSGGSNQPMIVLYT